MLTGAILSRGSYAIAGHTIKKVMPSIHAARCSKPSVVCTSCHHYHIEPSNHKNINISNKNSRYQTQVTWYVYTSYKRIQIYKKSPKYHAEDDRIAKRLKTSKYCNIENNSKVSKYQSYQNIETNLAQDDGIAKRLGTLKITKKLSKYRSLSKYRNKRCRG